LRILVTDLEDERIHNMVERLKPTIEERGIEFLALNPKSFESPEALNQVVREFAPDGFDDVVMLVPVPAVLSSSVPFMGRDSLMNIFAGIPAGKETTLNIGDIVNNGARYVGSSGSRTYHLQHTLDLAQSGRLNTAPALAAIGGMRALWEGIEGVANARFPGKTVIFPNCEHMPLTAVSDLADLVPGVEDTLDSNGYYSLETERALVAKFETNSD
jgi:threonine dehydrogenase-like Zn-dependent dehydrogenase